jgi:hypothetical protein
MISAPPAGGLAGRDLRANSAYTLQTWESLPEMCRRPLAAAIDPATVAGVLVARPGSSLPDKVVGSGGAALFTRLRRPGRAPDVPADLLASLVLDGVLEIQTDDGFRFGPAAHELLLEPQAWPADGDRLSRLSLAALRYAERLPLTGAEALAGPDALTARLYGFGRVPLSSRWARAYPGADAVLDLLRPAGIAQHWTAPANGHSAADWLSWRRTGAATPTGRPGLPYKLYVSPHVSELAEALPAAVTALNRSCASQFKIGLNAAGLLRPDKFMVYLRDAGELRAVAGELASALAGARPHGVPFSAELAGDGLLSWGGDPPQDAGPVGSGPQSWRLSVCRRLAEHLAAAKAAGLQTLSPAQYAVARLAGDGVRFPAFAPAGLPGPREAAA